MNRNIISRHNRKCAIFFSMTICLNTSWLCLMKLWSYFLTLIHHLTKWFHSFFPIVLSVVGVQTQGLVPVPDWFMLYCWTVTLVCRMWFLSDFHWLKCLENLSNLCFQTEQCLKLPSVYGFFLIVFWEYYIIE